MRHKDKSTDWQISAQRYLERLSSAEYNAGMAKHVKKGRKKSTYKHQCSQYHWDLVEALGDNDEERFKAIKGEQGYASEIKI